MPLHWLQLYKNEFFDLRGTLRLFRHGVKGFHNKKLYQKTSFLSNPPRNVVVVTAMTKHKQTRLPHSQNVMGSVPAMPLSKFSHDPVLEQI